MKVVDADKLISLLREKKFPKVGELNRIIIQMAFDVPDFSEKSDEGKDSQIDMTNVWYEVPTICRYVGVNRIYARGLLFHEYLIDLSTGRACTSQEILQNGLELGYDLDDIIIESFGWIDFSEIFHL